MLTFGERLIGRLQVFHTSGATPVFNGMPIVILNSSSVVPITPTGLFHWGFDFNPFATNALKATSTNQSISINASIRLQNGATKNCTTFITIPPLSQSDLENCEFVDSLTLQPLGTTINLNTFPREKNLNTIFKLKVTPIGTRPTILMRTIISNAITPYGIPSTFILPDSVQGFWGVNFVIDATTTTIYTVSLPNNKTACNLRIN